MFRLLLLLALLCAGIAGAQPKKSEPPPTEFPKIVVKKLERKPGEDPTPEQYAAYEKQFDPPTLPAVTDADKSPVARLAKHKLKAVVGAFQSYRQRVDAGISNASEFVAFCELSADLTSTADLAFETPKDRLAWYEYRVLMAKMGEQYYTERADARNPAEPGLQGIDPPYLLPRATAARLDAEIALCQLKAKLGK